MAGLRPLQLVDGLDPAQDPYLVYLSGFRPGSESRRAMRRCLNQVTALYLTDAGRVAELDAAAPPGRVPADLYGAGMGRAWWEMRYADTARVRALLIEKGGAPASIQQALTAMRQCLHHARRLGLMGADEYASAVDLDPVRGHREPAGRNIHPAELAAMLEACYKDPNVILGHRDAALLAMLHSTGIRRDEAGSVLIEKYDPRERSQLVTGKGNKQRTVFYHEAAIPFLDGWLVVLAQRKGPILRPVDKWGNIADRRMSARAVGDRVNIRRVQAGLPALTTHDFRHNFGGLFLDAGGDLSALQTLYGHASQTTTAAYDRRAVTGARKVVDKLQLPSPAAVGANRTEKT